MMGGRGFVSSFGPTSQLAHTLAVQRAIRRQLIAVVALLFVAGAWRLSPLHEPEPFTLVAMEIGAGILAVELALAWSEREETNHYADELILAGFADTTVCTPIGRAVARRMARLQSPRSRRRLAEALRWRVRLAEGWTRPSRGYVRASACPPLTAVQRNVFREDRDVVLAIAARIECAPADPRALITVERLITLPPECDPRVRIPVDVDGVRDQLRTVRDLIDARY